MPTLYYQKNAPFSQRVLLAFAYVNPICERIELDSADALPAAYAGCALPLVVAGEDMLDSSLEIMDWVLEPMEKASWIDWDLDEMDDSVYLLELCDGPFNDYVQAYIDAHSSEQRAEAGECAAGFLKQLDSLLQDSEYLLKDQPMLVDFAILPVLLRFINQDADFWQSNMPPRLGVWLQKLLADPVCKGILSDPYNN